MNVSKFVAVSPQTFVRGSKRSVNAIADETMTQSLTAIGRVGYSFVARVLGYALMGEEVDVFIDESTGIINSPSLHPSIMLVLGRNSESDTAGGRRRY
jgi:hypothetical protein